MMQHRILNTDVIAGLKQLPDKSVHCVITSPPYYGQRDYGVAGQIGLEDTPAEYLTKMVEIFRQVWRVLRDDGTVWVNMGDSYSSKNPTGRDDSDKLYHSHAPGVPSRGSLKQYPDRSPKNLMGMPWRLAFALQDDGWILRSDVIWSKPNPMPESVKDRPTKSHEYVFLLSKKARYFYDADAIREPQTGNAHSRGGGLNPKTAKTGSKIRANNSYQKAISKSTVVPGGRNIRTVWNIPTQARSENHFAAFPDKLAENCILAGTSEYGCCQECGAPWARVVHASGGTIGTGSWHDHTKDIQEGQKAPPGSTIKDYRRVTAGWEPGCNCEGNDCRVPCTVLDIFGGSGTVAKVARDLNRSSILIELNPDYVNITRRVLRIDEQLLDTGVVEYVV